MRGTAQRQPRTAMEHNALANTMSQQPLFPALKTPRRCVPANSRVFPSLRGAKRIFKLHLFRKLIEYIYIYKERKVPRMKIIRLGGRRKRKEERGKRLSSLLLLSVQILGFRKKTIESEHDTEIKGQAKEESEGQACIIIPSRINQRDVKNAS